MVEWSLTQGHADRCTRETVEHESKAPERSANRVFARSGVPCSPLILKPNASLAATAPESHATADVSLPYSRIAIGQRGPDCVRGAHDNASNESE